MAAIAPTSPSAVPSPGTGSPWLQGPVSDILLGTGMLYLPFFALSMFAGPSLTVAYFAAVPFLILLFAYSHLGATLLRVYARPEDRRAYRLFGVWLTIPLAATFLVGLWVPIVGSVMLTFYLTVVPWHFTGQNYGISLVFLRRRGIEITPRLKRYLWLTFFLSYLLWIAALHAAQPGMSDYSPLRLQGTQYAFLPLGIPAAALPYLAAILALSYLYALLEVVLQLRGSAPLRQLLPTGLVVLSQALWFSAPVIGRLFFEPSTLGPLAELWAPWSAASTFLVVSLMHSLQYLWITDYYVRKESPGTSTRGFLGKSLLAGMAIFGIPFLLLRPEVAGGPSYEAGLFLMLGGVLNVHHVMMDGVIWKLRNTKIASILIAGSDASEAPTPLRRRRSWVGPLIWASGVIGLLLAVSGELENRWGLDPAMAAGDPARLEASLDRLAWLGRDSSVGRARLGLLHYERGDTQGALRELERSVALRPKAETWLKIGKLREQRTQLREAVAAYEAALALAPNDLESLVGAARASLKLGELVRAQELLARAAALAPEDPDIRNILAAVDQAVKRIAPL